MNTNTTTYSANLSKRKALDYCLYMLLASYFDKAVCKNKTLENKLYLYYTELSADKQVDMEKRCLKALKKSALAKMPNNYFHQKVEISLVTKAGGETEILLDDGFTVIGVMSTGAPAYKVCTRKVAMAKEA